MTTRSTVKVTPKDVVDAMDWKDELRGDREVNCVKMKMCRTFIFTGARGQNKWFALYSGIPRCIISHKRRNCGKPLGIPLEHAANKVCNHGHRKSWRPGALTSKANNIFFNEQPKRRRHECKDCRAPPPPPPPSATAASTATYVLQYVGMVNGQCTCRRLPRNPRSHES